jgi:hypothetical protein
MEGLSHVDLHLLLAAEKLVDELTLMVAIQLSDDPSYRIHFGHGFNVGQLGNLDDSAQVTHIDSTALHLGTQMRTIL